MKIAQQTFGCKINQYETICILNEFLQSGWQQVDFSQPADVYLVNSCTVTNRTDYKSRNAIRKAIEHKKMNKNVIIVVTGCYAQLNYNALKEMQAVDYIIDNNHKNTVFQVINGLAATKFTDIALAEEFAEQSTANMINRHRAFIKVQDGCDFFCAYCAVAYARGRSRSRNAINIIEQIKALVQNGYQEFVLSGINLGLYGREKSDNYLLPHLLDDIHKLSGVNMIRLSSIEPQLFSSELLSFLADSKKIAPHFHIPLQSGSDKLLKLMGRKYSTEDFKITLDKILTIYPDAALGFDVIAGLPSESEACFVETREFLEKIPFAYLHVFPYSRRSGTKACSMPDQINGKISHQRVVELNRLSLQKKKAYKQKLIDEQVTLAAILESRKNNYYTGLSDHYIRIYCRSKNLKEGMMIKGYATGFVEDGLLLEVIDD
jgi:threonylcarbamoyladenosine tRNA methylthiotransferase MtaB